MNREELINEIQRLACSCDVMRGYACPIHAPINKLRKLLSPARGDGTELIKRLRNPANQFLFDPQVSGPAWKLLHDAADFIERATPTPPSAEGVSVGKILWALREYYKLAEGKHELLYSRHKDAIGAAFGHRPVATPVSTQRMTRLCARLEALEQHNKSLAYDLFHVTAERNKLEGQLTIVASVAADIRAVAISCKDGPNSVRFKWAERLEALSPQPQEDNDAK